MKIKIKVKTLLLLFLIFIFIYLYLIPFAYLEIAGHLDKKGSDKARVFYESFLSRSYVWNKSKALYEYASGMIGPEERFQIMLAGWGGGNNKSIEDLEKGVEALEKILNKKKKSRKDMKYALLAYPKILNTHIQLQSPEDLLEWIKWGKEIENEKIAYTSDIYMAYYHIVNRDYDLAEKLMNKYDEDMGVIDYRYYFTKGEIALWQGNTQDAIDFYSVGDKKIDNYIENQAHLFGSPIYQRRRQWFDYFYDEIRGSKKVKGRITHNGKPMPFVEIYLHKKEEYVSMRSLVGDLVAITDINGEYETLGLAPGKYDIGLGISPALLLDKIYQKPDGFYIKVGEIQEYDFTFISPFKLLSPEEDIIVKDNSFKLEWESVPGADYYQVQIHSPLDPFTKDVGHISYFLEDENSRSQIKTNWGQFDINKLNIMSSRYISSDGEGKLLPGAIMGRFHANNDYSISVNAYNKEAKLINSTAGLWAYDEAYKKLTIERDYSKGEKLIIDRKYEEAIDYYETIVEKDSKNLEALLYLAQLYHMGLMPKEQNFHKALGYSQRYDKEIKDNLLTYKIIMDMDNETTRKYKDIVKSTLDEVLKEGRDADIHHYLGKYYLSLKDYDLAKENLKKSIYSTRKQIIYIDLYKGDIKSLLEGLDHDEDNFYNLDRKSFEESLRKIDSETLESKDYRVLQEFFDKILSEDVNKQETYNLYRKEIQDPNLKNILNQIAMEEGWLLSY